MSCYFPLRAVEISTKENGKKEISFKHSISEEDLKRGYIIYQKQPLKVIELPCGKCIGCRLDYSRDWANRCMQEAKEYENNYFLTLTYDDEHLKRQIKIEKESGEVLGIAANATLFKRDLQLFMKKLRIEWERKHGHIGIRFFACGEYGDKRGRPHYHIILFNMPIFDLKEIRKSDKGQTLWASEEIEKIWGQGITAIGEVNWDTAAYTARYVMKKIKGPNASEIYEAKGQTPEFTLMSRKPGIGKNFFDKHSEEIYKYDEMLVKTKKGVIHAKPARYYDKLYDLSNPPLMKKIKEERKRCAETAEKIRAEKTDLSIEEYRAVQERTKRDATKSLRRKYEKGLT